MINLAVILGAADVKHCGRCLGRWAALLCLAGLTALASPKAEANTIQLRSGEHTDFSRFVLDLENLPNWRVESDGRSRRLTFDGPLVRIDVSTASSKLRRGRVRQMTSGVNELYFELGCACSVHVFGLSDGRLVIDVKDGGKREPAVLASAEDEPTYQTGFVQSRVLNQEVESIATQPSPQVKQIEIQLEMPFSTSAHGVFVPLWSASPPTALSPPTVSIPRSADGLPIRPAHDEEHWGSQAFRGAGAGADGSVDLTLEVISPFGARQRISEATSAMVEALDRAGDLGLVERIESQRIEQRTTLPERPPPGAPLPLPIGNSPSLRVSTSLDRDLARLASALDDRAEQSGCLNSYDLDVGVWGDPDAPESEFTAARNKLFAEFDAPDLDAARQLVRSYLFMSFGAEAQAVLASFPFEDHERAVYAFLAEVADGITRPPDDEAAALVGCPGPAALWSLISVRDLPKSTDVAKSEIAAAFSALPLHLRKRYGPILVQRFLALDDPGTARVIWNAVDRAGARPEEKFILASAELAAATGDELIAERAYGRLEGASGETAPKAVVLLIQSRLGRGMEVDPGLVNTAAALSFEHRGTPVSRSLKIEEIRGRTSLNQWDLVFEELPKAEFAGTLTRDDAKELLVNHYLAIVARADTANFLRRAFEANARLDNSERADPARRAVAKRLNEIGFYQMALDLMKGVQSDAPDDFLIIADAYLQAGRAQDALATLSDRYDQRAQSIRATALLALGQFDAAAQVFQEVGEADAAALASSRAGGWRASPLPLATAAERITNNKSNLPDTPLARNEELVNGSEVLREQIAKFRLAAAGLQGATELQ